MPATQRPQADTAAAADEDAVSDAAAFGEAWVPGSCCSSLGAAGAASVIHDGSLLFSVRWETDRKHLCASSEAEVGGPRRRVAGRRTTQRRL